MEDHTTTEVEYSSIQIQKTATGGEFITGQKQLDIPLYDTEELVAGAQIRKYGVSKTYQGSGPLAGTSKSIAERNWPGSGGVLPSPREFAVTSISVQVLTASDGGQASLKDLLQLRAWSILHFLQHKTRIWSMRLTHLGGPGLVGLANAAAAGGFINIGSAFPADVHDLQMAFAIGTGQPVSAEIETTTDFAPADPMRVMVRFEGYSYKSLG